MLVHQDWPKKRWKMMMEIRLMDIRLIMMIRIFFWRSASFASKKQAILCCWSSTASFSLCFSMLFGSVASARHRTCGCHPPTAYKPPAAAGMWWYPEIGATTSMQRSSPTTASARKSSPLQHPPRRRQGGRQGGLGDHLDDNDISTINHH